MGQFKPMVKMETTEPTVELKLKKGGHVNMKKGGKAEAGHKKMAMGGGAMDMMMGTPALVGRPAVNAPVRTPGKPSMASRRKAMMAKPAVTPSGPSMAPPPMKKGGKAEGGKSDMAQDKAMIKKAFKQHDMQEHKGGKGTSLKLKKGGKMATGGVINGQGGYKKGGGVSSSGIINTEGQGGEYRNTKMDTAKPNHSPAKTGGVKDGNGGGYKTGGVTKSNAGGYKMGGKTSKKAYATGGTVNSGKPVAMSEGRKPVPAPVRINQLAGTYKNGGKATPAEARLLKSNAAENASAMRDANMDSNLKYGSPKRMKEGGTTDMSNGAYDAHYANEKAENEEMRNMILDPLKNMGKHIMRSFDPSGYFKGDERKKMFETDARMGLADKIKSDRAANGQGAVTKTEKSITVSPAGKKRGGRAC